MTEQEQPREVRHFMSIQKRIRQVPLNWEHPKDEKGDYKPLIARDMAYTEEEVLEGLEEGWIKSKEEVETWYMPDFSGVPEEQMGICAYEDVTEGTPISPVFPNTPEGRLSLAKHCMENEPIFGTSRFADIETWAAALFGDNTPLLDIRNKRIEIHDSRPDIEA